MINDHDQQMSAKVEKVFNVYCSVFECRVFMSMFNVQG